MQVITSAIDSRDGVFIGGKHLRYIHKPLKTMTNNELTLIELSTVSGGKNSGLVSFISEPDVGAGTNKTATRKEDGKQKSFWKGSYSGVSVSTLKTNFFTMSEW